MAKEKAYFDAVEANVDFPKKEKELLDKWYRKGIVSKYLNKNSSSSKTFSFLDGPITANNPMGVHHAWGRTYKDLWQRYKNMKGFRQRFQNGFDCQGLWVEVEVEKELGIKSKKDIENLVPGDKKASIAKFVDMCRERVKKYSSIQTGQSKQLGFFMDWDNSYYTLSENNNYAIWHFLKVCYENGWIYKGNDVVPWCPRCETAISQHEILTEDYKEVTHKSVYFKLPVKENPGEYLLVWTTTPWTIPANTAVAVDGNYTYVLVEDNNECFWILKELSEKIFGKDAKVVREVKGKELVGLSYKSPFDDLPYVKKLTREEKEKFHKVIVTDSLLMPITTEEGTGLVHTSTSTGEEDHKLGKKLGLPVNPAINDKGEYLDSFGILSGKNAKKEPELIFNILDEKGFLFKVENYTHRYPACWRCKTELMWKVTDEWYIAMDSLPKKEEQKNLSNKTLRQRMIEIAKKIKWLPGFGLERELDWLTNMHDWLISKKNRFWGLALPVWECPECNYFEVIGSKEELREKSSSGWENFEGKTPHKPQIDEIKINCPKCNGVMERIEPVGNPWLDAGIVAFSTISENNKACLFEKSSEVPLYFTDKKVWQEWFPADFITESFPGQFKNWFYSLIAMSAVLENTEPAKTILGFATLLAEDGRAMHKSLGNAIEFGEGAEKIGVDVMRWLFVRQNPAENLLFGYKVADETRRRFHLKLWNVYNFFITYANLDSWKPEGIKTPSFDTEKSNPLDRWIIARLNQTIKECSEKLDNFDAYSASGEIENLVNDLSNWYIRRSRERVGLVASCEEDKNNFYKTCYQVLLNLSYLLAPFTPYLADLIYTNLTKKESVHLADWPGPVSLKHKDLDLIEEMAALREIVEKVHAVRKESKIPVRQPLKSVKVTLSLLPDFSEKLLAIAREELNIKEIIFVKGKEGIELDTRITPELAEEAKARELIRSIQEKRKDLGLSLTQKAKVISPWVPENGGLTDKILRKTMTSSLQKGRTFKVEKE